ncbi:MAG: hypothetical protein IT452_02825 [Planctomycetia bacterium]|nr:hypothetical protein [Planctomycetia bacterium]
MTASRPLCALAVAAAAVIASSGCRKIVRKTIYVRDAGIFTTDDFPGASVQDGNVADDKRAMSPSNQSFQNMKITFNGDRGTALVTYLTFSVGVPTVYCHHFDGETWTPPVVLEADDVALGASPAPIDVNRVCHAFINTADAPTQELQDRDGDAIIFWSAPDVDSDGAGPDGVNQCLFATYFDASRHDEPSGRYGFQEKGVRLNMDDEGLEDVSTFAVLSDGMCGEARWTQTANRYTYGDSTTGIAVVWAQRENNDLVAGVDDSALHMVWFDLGGTAESALPLPPGTDTRLGQVTLGASDDGSSSEETQVSNVALVTYNSAVFFRCAARNTFVGDEIPAFLGFGTTANNDVDETIQAISVNLATGVPEAPRHLSVSPSILATDSLDNRAQFLNEDGDFLVCNSVYGSDQGLANLVVFTTQLIDHPLGSFFDPLASARLCIAEIDEATGSVLSAGAVDAEDPDVTDLVFAEHADTRMSRNGDSIWIAWRELTDGGVTDNLGLWAAGYVTTRPDEDGLFTIPPLSDSLSPPMNLNVDVDAEDVRWFMFQDALGYRCGVQSDPDVVHVLFEQSDGTFDRILDVRLTGDLSTPAVLSAAPPVVIDTFEQGEQGAAGQTVHNEHTNFDAVDAGSDGEILCVYRKDVDVSAATDFRLMAARTGVAVERLEIDSTSTNRQVPSQTVRLVPTPPGTDIGRLDVASGDDSPDRPRPAEFVHVLFMEDAVSEVDALGDALRTRYFDARDPGTPFEESFLPSLGAEFVEPFELSLPFTTPSVVNAPTVLGTAVAANRVGLWFREENHIYYQEFDPDAGDEGWRVIGDDGGLSDPALVDDDSTEDVQFFTLFVAPTCTCENLGGAMIFWNKTFEGTTVDARLQVRVREPLDR